MRICTIVARNYLAYARVLAESYLAQDPTGQCVVLVIDDVDDEVDEAIEPFALLRPCELDIERFEAMAAMYDVTELATAIKPWLLEHLLAHEDGAPVAYFDPDIRFYAPVDEIERLAVRHELVLTPHITTPIPDDQKQPGELDLMASGTYNLGFVAMAPGARVHELLEWWQNRLRYDCVIDHALGYFVDQRWFDLVPNTFPGTAVIRDPGMNVAYWNLHERTITRDHDGAWLVNGQPLRFFHFSGFDPDEPHLLSKHQTRTRLSEHPDLATLCREFAGEVRAQRRGEEITTPYAWDMLGDGRPWDRRLRRLYREGERAGVFRFSPFGPEGAREFLEWLNEPALEAGTPIPLSRFWFDLYQERQDLQIVFPDLAKDIEEYMRWIDGHGREIGDVRGLMPQTDDTEPDTSLDGVFSDHASSQEPWGVNVAGFLQSELGIGEAGRGLISGLDAARIPVLPLHGEWRPSSRQEQGYAMLNTDSAAFPINIVCVNADVLPRWAAQAGEKFFADRYTIGFWWWEVLAFPTEWLSAFDLVDEVWVATEHVANALMPVSSVPVTKITMPVSAPPVGRRSRRELGLPEGFLFLFLFDHHSVLERKNPLAVIEAFKQAFPASSGASLVVKSINHEYHADAHERLLLAASEHPDVHLIDRYVTARDKNAMIASADCYVSLHRAEGFGLTLAEAMCMGKPVIATRYGGNLDFMDDHNSWLVDCEMVPIGPGQTPYPAEGEWANPDLEQAAGHMRAILADPTAVRERATLGARHIGSTHSAHAAGRSMQRRLEHIYSRRGHWPRSRHDETSQPELDHLAELIARGGHSPSHSLGRARRFIRRLVLRLIKPFTAYQRTVDTAVLDSLRALARDTAATRGLLQANRLREAQVEAAQLAELRRQSTRLEEISGDLERPMTDLPGITREVGRPTAAPTPMRRSRRTSSGA
jgi:glycosyltransferase involved in cell wall biosynthesis